MSLTVRVAGKTDIGIVRANNEDTFGFDLAKGIFVVCDGMGGMASGEFASALGVETILKYFQNGQAMPCFQTDKRPENGSSPAPALAEALRLANEAIYQEAASNQERSGMGATVVAARVEGDSFSVANVGDSRAYLIRNKSMRQLTNDHSVVMEQVRLGLLTLEQAKVSRMQNLVTRALGARDTVEPDLSTHAAVAGDVLLLCTDGLHRYVADEKLLEIITSSQSLEKVCDSLIETAKACESDDNITCVLLCFAEPTSA
ncbi:MAG TPA: Stp1/IreP family PP2C-type Ser/Thr phosphatase [Terriglobales bacterium]|nr:Stp1/IreP family PP2C-type Ser/Thr phosphatase [Terriglobales bacterium]